MLYVVPTPIGNLEDITLRALRVLKEVDLVVAEDSRTTGNLLRHFSINKPIVAFHKYNEHTFVHKLIERLKTGENIALTSDAGTPGISDPGFLLIRECVANGIEVITLPGATALIPALVNSGLPSDKFVFEGFLPQKKGKNKRILELQSEHRTIIFYESPYRLTNTLQMLGEIFGEDRKAVVCREISKIYEETIRGTLGELSAHFSAVPPKGEIVLVVDGNKN
ncbi:MAG TPA: 16S rRNA (cytidine(1402)-2'-O)-methyltransferase [Salinivirgaceae bacterium]|nr:16S rRNA (cytidine(1402)-2'-O)-methyltransferase [Salinivirgaceae bacterium]